MKYRFLQQLFIAVDQTANTVIGGWADETISARAYRCGSKEVSKWALWRVLWKVIDALFFAESLWLRYRDGKWPVTGHCQRAYIAEKIRAQLPPEYREAK